ncbi:MAG: oligosaccharide flippase family protein [Candidatus Woesearchaeota archaeon]
MFSTIKKTTYLTISNILIRLSSVLFFIILARSLSVSNYGSFRYLLTLSMMIGLFFTGIPTALTKYLSEKKDHSYTSTSLFLMSFIFIILLIPSLFYDYRLSLFLFALLVDAFYLGFIRGLLNYIKLAGFKLLENIIQLIILIVSYILLKEINFDFAVIFYSFSGILSLIIFEIIKPEIKLTKIDKQKIKQIITYTIPVTLGSIGWTLMFGINSIFIKMFHDTEQLGYFSVGTTIVQVFTFLPEAITTILMPKTSSLKDKSKLKKPLKLAILGTIITSTIGLILLLILNKFLITLLFGEKYIKTSLIILPLSLGQIFISLHQIYASIFQGLNKPQIPSTTISIAAFLNIIGSYFLTKNYGILGSSISNAITSFIALIIILIIFKKDFQKFFI